VIVKFKTADRDANIVTVLTLGLQDGRAVRLSGDESLAERVLSGKFGDNPGQVEGAVDASDGEKFLRRLPRNFTGIRLFAEVVEE
jgi:hypothetical protein